MTTDLPLPSPRPSTAPPDCAEAPGIGVRIMVVGLASETARAHYREAVVVDDVGELPAVLAEVSDRSLVGRERTGAS